MSGLRLAVRALAVWVGFGLGCSQEPAAPTAPDEHAPAAPMAARPQDRSGDESEAESERSGLPRQETLGPFLSEHWQLPVPLQGAPPEGWSPIEASLDPESCASCHPDQHAQWQTSLHAAAYSPGFAGQLIEGSLAQPAQLRSCQTCHAPLEEQQPVTAVGSPSPDHDAALRRQGIVCASCHIRQHGRYGPPRRAELPPPLAQAPHGGFEVRAEFQESRFCATCHQFFDDAGVNGKPLENTFFEWQASPHARQGKTCQSCHMPDRAHVWRGIHDEEMVRSAVDVALEAGDLAGEALAAALVLTSREVGHMFPSYVTPRVFLAVWQEDSAGQPIEGSRQELTVGREIDFGRWPWAERFDTRIAPGGSARLEYAAPRAAGAAALRGRVSVDPDYHYRGVFDELRRSLKDPDARAMMDEAYRRTTEAPFVVSEVRRELTPR